MGGEGIAGPEVAADQGEGQVDHGERDPLGGLPAFGAQGGGQGAEGGAYALVAAVRAPEVFLGPVCAPELLGAVEEKSRLLRVGAAPRDDMACRGARTYGCCASSYTGVSASVRDIQVWPWPLTS
ncbi:hypothetical protein GCM10010359_42600 [Streptomyces morookaense]|nr:hypothetical protein GCM10010359_42600 [Streptomyces morookaense]